MKNMITTEISCGKYDFSFEFYWFFLLIDWFEIYSLLLNFRFLEFIHKSSIRGKEEIEGLLLMFQLVSSSQLIQNRLLYLFFGKIRKALLCKGRIWSGRKDYKKQWRQW